MPSILCHSCSLPQRQFSAFFSEEIFYGDVKCCRYDYLSLSRETRKTEKRKEEMNWWRQDSNVGPSPLKP